MMNPSGYIGRSVRLTDDPLTILEITQWDAMGDVWWAFMPAYDGYPNGRTLAITPLFMEILESEGRVYDGNSERPIQGA